MKKTLKKLLSLALTLVMLFQLMPLHAWAEGGTADINTAEQNEVTEEQQEAVQNGKGKEVVGEDCSQRGENEKHFHLSDGSWLAVSYPGAVHYEENGEWVEIDNWLDQEEVDYSPLLAAGKVSDASEAQEAAYVNRNNRFGVSLPVVLTDHSWIGVSDRDKKLYFKLKDTQESVGEAKNLWAETDDPVQKATQVHVSSTVSYRDIYPGVDLQYDLNYQTLKENLVFHEPGAIPEELVYTVLAEGMTAEVKEDGSVVFAAEGEAVFIFPAPFLMDSAGEYSEAVKVDITELSPGEFELRYRHDREWLEAENRAWPVVLDPVITNVVNTNYIRDAYIRQGYPSYGGGLFYYFYAGYYSGATRAVRGLIKHTQIPSMESGDVVVNATLTAYGKVYQSNGTQIQVDAHAITGDWDSQTVNWNNQPSHESEVLDFQIVDSTTQKLYSWDVTSAVQRWYGGTASGQGSLANQGFILISPTESVQNVLMAQFPSSDSTSAIYWPMLYIYYTNTTGLESYWDYTSASAGRAGSLQANNYTGNLVVSRSDMSYSGNRMPVSIGFTYNQNDCDVDIGYGKGWRSSYSQRIEQVSLSGVTYYKWTDGDGTRIYFYYNNGAWIDEAGQNYTLTIGGSGYTISDRDANKLSFDANGRLTAMTDRKGNSIAISYAQTGTNLRISQITDGAGRRYTFSYSNDRLSGVNYYGAGNTALETVSYTYSNGQLSTVTYADGKSAGYSYSGNTLTEARDILRSSNDRNKICVSYGGNPSKVTQFAYYDGSTAVSSVSLLYGNHYTKVTDNVGRYGIYQFNNYGNTVSVYNQEGQAMYGSFATDESSNGRANQLRRSSRLQDTVVNLLSTRKYSVSWSQTVTVQSGKYYTLSGIGAVGSTLTVTAGSTSRSATAVSSTERTELSIQIPNGVTSLTISGSGNYSQLQLEQAESSSRYNLLKNTDMNSSSYWAWTNLSSGDGITTRSGTRAQLNSSALVLTGGAATTKRYYQTISNLNGVAGDDYSFGAWVQSGSVPLTNVNTPGASTTRRCGIEVRLLNGSAVVNSKYIAANPACHEWQFLSGSVRATGTYNAVEFSYVYDYNGNNSYFDGAQLFKEKFSYIYDYDSQNRVQTITDLEGRVTTYAYRGTSSDITSIQLPGGESYSYTYNSTSNLLETASTPLGVTTSYTYDSHGNPTKAEIGHSGFARKLESQTTYTSDGNMTATVTGNDGNTVSYSNDTDLSLVTSATDPKGAITQNSYDLMRRPTQSQVGSSAVTNTYADDRLTSLSHTNTSTASTTYNLSYTTGEQLYQVKVGSAYTLVQNSYNSGTWTLQSQNYGNGAAWVYEYNSFDQVTRRYTTNGSAGLEFLYFYNSEGQLGRIEQYTTTLSSGSITSRTLAATERYYYDTADRLIRVWETDSPDIQHEFRWSYNSNDQVTELVETLNGKSFTYTNSYNNDQQPSQSSYGNALKSFTYDGLGRLSQSAVSSGNSAVLTTAYTYRDWGTANTTTQVATLSNSYGSANTPTSESFSYTYDANGNIASVTYGSNTTIYEYDALNELVWEKNAAASKAWEYSYDLGGNILSKKEYDYQNGVVGSTPLSTITYTYGDASWPDLLTAYNGSPITYDGIGNPTSYRGWSFTWQGGRQLASASDGTTSLSFAYNESGLRTGKTVGSATHRYIYRGSLLVAEIASNYALYFHHDANGEIVGFTYSANNTDTEYFYRKNLQGDVVGIVDAAGVSAAEYRYDAWGNILSATGAMASLNPIRYRGYYYDVETGLYYVSSRYYDPEICRFVNADDTSYLGANGDFISYNLFAYCLNNPINRTDDGGNLSVGNWIKIGIGAVALGAAIALTVATGGGAAAVAVGIAKIVGSVALSTATSAGLGYLANGKEGAIDGACNGFMFGSLSACGGAALKYTQVRTATTGTPNSIGQAGERMAGIDPKAKQPININGRTRIPDALTDSTLTEVKNVKYISNTQQLRDFADFANATGRTLDLYVRPTTRIAQTVIDAGWNIRYLW